MGKWEEMFDPKRPVTTPPPAAGPHEPADTAPPLDLRDYQPWIIQRGRTRPALFLDLRRFEVRTGMPSGCQMSYPHLQAMDYIGDRMVSLDFGLRKFVIEGEQLDELTRHLQQGTVLVIQEYCSRIWSTKPTGPIVTAIKLITSDRAKQ